MKSEKRRVMLRLAFAHPCATAQQPSEASDVSREIEDQTI